MPLNIALSLEDCPEKDEIVNILKKELVKYYYYY